MLIQNLSHIANHGLPQAGHRLHLELAAGLADGRDANINYHQRAHQGQVAACQPTVNRLPDHCRAKNRVKDRQQHQDSAKNHLSAMGLYKPEQPSRDILVVKIDPWINNGLYNLRRFSARDNSHQCFSMNLAL